jgi:uncharacterized protein (UPF0332 family)
MDPQQQEVTLYIQNALEMLDAARILLQNGFLSSAINRSYYAVFYAANALLATKGINQGKHSGVINAFRQNFIKTGLIDQEYSRIYGRLMEDRHESDYELGSLIDQQTTNMDLEDAVKFVNEMREWLKREKWI